MGIKQFKVLYSGCLSNTIDICLTHISLYFTVWHIRQDPGKYIGGSRRKGERVLTSILSRISGISGDGHAEDRRRRYAMSSYLRLGKRWKKILNI